jgi:hypothetical protein
MNFSPRQTRWMATLLLAAFVTAGVGSVAQADRGYGHDRGTRYKNVYRGHDTRVISRYRSPGSVYVVRRSDHGAAIAGFLGGLFLGATLAHAAPDGYGYYDPYCDESFASLEIYRGHLYHHHHPRIVRVIELRSGDCVHTYRYERGQWDDYDDQDWGQD